MVPLTTMQGFSRDEIVELTNNRDIYLWGRGGMLRDVRTSLLACGLSPVALLDTSVNNQRGMGIPVVDPADVIHRHWDAGKKIIIIATVSFRDQAESLCNQYGLVKGKDYIDYLDVSRPAAIVDVSGRGELYGSIPSRQTSGYMSLDVYRKVLKKLMHDLPLLTGIELSAGHEPLLNPEIAEIIRETEQHVPCVVATSLRETNLLEGVILSRPSELNVIVNGIENSLKVKPEGGTCSLLEHNLKILSSLKKKFKSSTNISIKVHSFKLDTEIGKERIITLARNLQLNLSLCRTHPAPYDELLNYLENRQISRAGLAALENLPWDLQKILCLCRRGIGSPCLSQRIFPIIHWDLSVSLCHVFDRPVICRNYLDVDWPNLLKMRHSAQQCELCQRHALHRLDLNVLTRRHPKETQIG